jgi:hypothetical protein
MKEYWLKVSMNMVLKTVFGHKGKEVTISWRKVAQFGAP